jgi:hypothetical protein
MTQRLAFWACVVIQLCGLVTGRLGQSSLRYTQDFSLVDAWDADQVAGRWARAQATQIDPGSDPMFNPALSTDFAQVLGGDGGAATADGNLDQNLVEMSARTDAGLNSDAETRDLSTPYFEPDRTLQNSFDVNAGEPDDLPTGGFGDNLQLAENAVSPKGGQFGDNLKLASSELMSDSQLRGNIHRIYTQIVPASLRARPAPPKGRLPVTIWDGKTAGSAESAIWDMPVASGLSYDAPLVTKQFDVGTLS